ncbi:diguanylate cyclase [Andreprevotia lacus DSM 23236]|jgi:diguanylate cyclase|uniref:diguanylate cyclase n=1 Tax=Andreprevotia lacus DSM 23236 TaxID=1121001 RepID=A0A1W1XN91_9NEIS|nr:sensor domain-containing diguanylate cyclase [Andreprevotia lacus]SMC25325.1 diguanylate cyclase [Andreprevotia lacus DSM 23236]
MADTLIAELSATLGKEQSFEALVRQLLSMLELVTDLESTYLTQIDLEAGQQHILYARNSQRLQIPEGLTVPWGDTLCKRALDEDRCFTDDVANVWGDSEAATALGIATYASTPVRLEDGSLYGTLCAASSARKPLTDHGAQVLQLFAGLIARHIEKEQLVQQLQAANAALTAHSYTDALTNLPNRRAVFEELPRLFAIARREGRDVMIAFIDLDGFKQINDQHGHEAGDAFLIQTGKRLHDGLRAGDILGRLGGDEFIVAGIGPGSHHDATEAARAMKARLTPLLQGQFDLGPCRIDYPGASIGIIATNPATSTPETALREADTAMYQEKQRRRQGTTATYWVQT